jgi:hypothetical protein
MSSKIIISIDPGSVNFGWCLFQGTQLVYQKHLNLKKSYGLKGQKTTNPIECASMLKGWIQGGLLPVLDCLDQQNVFRPDHILLENNSFRMKESHPISFSLAGQFTWLWNSHQTKIWNVEPQVIGKWMKKKGFKGQSRQEKKIWTKKYVQELYPLLPECLSFDEADAIFNTLWFMESKLDWEPSFPCLTLE